MIVSPARRRVEGPSGHAQVEPLIMQVFLLLLDADGQVVTRDQLFDAGWGGAMVGDDSLNRAINRVRRIDADVGPGVFEIETVPRTGYRLIGDFNSTDDLAHDAKPATPVARRAVIAGGVAAAAIAGFGLWSRESRADKQFDALLSRGQQALDYSDPAVDAEPYFKQALTLRPKDARALGLHAFALVLRTERPGSRETGQSLLEADHVAHSALAIDPLEPNARLALILSHQSTLDLIETENRLRQILSVAPRNINVLRYLWNLLQCVGRSREALALVDRSLAIAPFAAGSHYPKAQLLWITGQTAEADRVIDKAIQYWPSHRFVRFARFTILAFTGRAKAALAMLDSEATRPQAYTPEEVALWRTSLAALDNGSSAAVDAARKANLEKAMSNLALCRQAAICLSALGDVDGAFAAANALFAVQDGPTTHPSPRASSAAWRFAPWMFIPPTAPMRADPRFAQLCEGIGLTDYWAKQGVRPDYQRSLA